MTSKPEPTVDTIPLADDETTEEITEADILKLSLGSGNKSRAAAVVATQSGSQHNQMSSMESIPYGGVSNSSSSPAQPSCMFSYSKCLFFKLTLFVGTQIY